MEHDTASATYVAHQAALALYPSVVVATPIPVGISEHWMEWKGTLSLRRETFAAVAFDICESLQRHGIEHILIVNGHAGNGPLREHMEEFREKLGIDLEFCSYWESYTQEFVAEHLESGDCPAHAAEFETSMAMAAFPKTCTGRTSTTTGNGSTSRPTTTAKRTRYTTGPPATWRRPTRAGWSPTTPSNGWRTE